ncbi:hypothetical protein UPYG_G00101340 [Umbra pygmaea]|uniref:C3H1-type domain-containing protein n=1 Tax=Umbra pygmaea TaxID=75934 RepID=A0ABD0XNC8_UMBPY
MIWTACWTTSMTSQMLLISLCRRTFPPPPQAQPLALTSACQPLRPISPAFFNSTPMPHLPPAFFNATTSQLNSLDTFPGACGRAALGTLDSLDTLDCLDNLSDLGAGETPDPVTTLDCLDTLDALDSFAPLGGAIAAKPLVVVGGMGLDSLSEFDLPDSNISHSDTSTINSPKKSNSRVVNNGQIGSKHSQLTRNPLAATHDFKQACATCYRRIGPGALDYQHHEHMNHRCQQDILLCMIKALGHPVWNRVRPRPKQNFNGVYMLCKEVLESRVCQYKEACTFAYCQEEVDVWTLERKGVLNRELLFEPEGPKDIKSLLQLYNGMFVYLCQECYDSKPRIISKCSKEVPSICSNLSAPHPFDDKKCLVHVVRSNSVAYTKIRPLHSLCQLDMCHRAVHYGCQREDSCCFAHSIIELKCWLLQHNSGITHEQIVQESKQHWHKHEQNTPKQKPQPPSSSSGDENHRGGRGGRGGSNKMNFKMNFVCGQCWSNGLISEPDKTFKYCTAKARHSWTKDRWVLLVLSSERRKWVMVRALPSAKIHPHHYDICAHVVKQKKCHYIGNCNFAHSEEEKEVWTYMKNNGLTDMQQMYDIWLTMTKKNRRSDDTMVTQHREEKKIIMPTDFAEPMSGFHCRLCGRHSNTEHQWQQHISSEKHKDRVFSCDGEDESLSWIYRFPGLHLSLCPRLESVCPEGVSCDYAHSAEELVEWQERREFLRRKLAKAREDMLIMPDEYNFGKYNFLLQD